MYNLGRYGPKTRVWKLSTLIGKEMDTRAGELLGEVRAKVTSQTIKELTPLGVKIEFNGEGQFAGGKLNSRHLETTSMFQKPDGTFEWEAKAMEATMDGEMAVFNGKGTGKSTGPSTIWGEGDGIYMTRSPGLAWLNGLRVRVEVTGDRVTRDYSIKVRMM